MSDRDPDDPVEPVGGPADAEPDDGDDGWEWEYTLEDIAEREAEAEAVEEKNERRSEPVEAGTPSLEGIVFVLLGVAFTLFVLWRLLAG